VIRGPLKTITPVRNTPSPPNEIPSRPNNSLAANRPEAYPNPVSENQDSPSAAEKGGPAYGSWIIFGLFGLLVVYPLSIGPMAKFYEGKATAPSWLRGFYAPLIILEGHSDTAKKFFNWYVKQVWGVK
jgi:hypothetical protein